MEENKKKRGWVKDAAIIFLAVLLVLTFFSNTILNRSLPEVATVYVEEGTITSKVRGTGTVTARENYDVTIEQTRKVQSVLVRTGDEVNVGDVLFTLQPGDSDELENAEKQLRELEDAYQLWLLDLTVADYYEYDRNIADAREALVEARTACDEAVVTEEETAEYEAKLADMETAIEEQQALVETADELVAELGDTSGTLRQYELQMRELTDQQHQKDLLVREAEKKLTGTQEQLAGEEAEQDEDVATAQKNLDDVENEINEKYGNHQDPDYTPVSEAKAAYEAAQEATEKADEEYLTTRVIYGEDYDALVQVATNMEYDYQVYAIESDTEKQYRLDNNIGKETELTEEQKQEVEEEVQRISLERLGTRSDYQPKQSSIYLAAAAEMYAGSDMATAYDKINYARQNVESKRDAEREAKAEYNKAYEDYKEKKEDDKEFQALDRKKTRAQTALDKASAAKDKALEPLQTAVEAAERELKSAKAEQTEAGNAVSDLQYLIDQIRNGELADRTEELSNAEKKLEELTAERDKLKSEMEAREEEYKQAKKDVKTQERTLEDLVRSLDQEKKNDNKQQVRNSITQKDKLQELEEQRALVEELSSVDNGTEVKANVAGTVQSLSVSAGHKAEAGSVLATIEVPDLGYSMSFSVTTEQARRLKAGDSATVSNYYWGSQITATLVSIQTDPQNPQGSRILNFDVTGDVTAGNSLTIAVGERNANYDMVVPNSAVRSDTNGSFVLMVTAKNSPLGNRYFATRVNVEVIASDEQYSAISGAIEAYDSVITTASRNAPIESGDQVRLADSNN